MNLLNNLFVIYIPILIIVWFVLVRKNYRLGLNLLFVSAISVIAAVILKELFKTGGGEILRGFQLSKYRFPSLGVQLATTFWLYWSTQSNKISLYLLTISIVIFVAYEKLISNQHSLLDVFGGLAIGLLIVFSFIRFKDWKSQLNAKV